MVEDKYAAYLAALAGQGPSPTPANRDEALMNAIIERQSSFDNTETLFNAELAISPAIVTKRVEGGTQLLNPLWANKACATVGFTWNPDEAKKKLYTYVVFSYVLPDSYTFKKYNLYEKESEEDPYELTLENAPHKEEISGSVNYKYTDKSTLVSHMDQRFCLQVFDPNGKEVDRIYSAQYRYYANGGNPTRTLVPTAPQDPSYVIDICLRAPTSYFYDVLRTIQPHTAAAVLYPLVSTPQSSSFQLIVPDTLFEEAEATYGLMLAVVMGDDRISYGPRFDKAEDTGPFVVTLTPTGADLSGTMNKSPQEIAEAVVSRKRIFIAVPSLGGLVGEMSQFIPVPTDGGDPLYEVWGNFVYLNYNGIDIFIIIKLKTDLASAPTYFYDTNIYPLTPAT